MPELFPIHVNLDATKPVDRVFKTITRIVNAVFKPWIARQNAKARAIDVESEGQVVLTKEIYQQQINHLRQHDPERAYCYENLIHIMEIVVEKVTQLKLDSDPEQPLDQTFANNWRQEAELIDDDELRHIWAALLLEEAIKPDSISLRTLDVVRKMSACERRIFLKYSIACFSEGLLAPRNYQIFKECSKSEIRQLQFAGIIQEIPRQISLNEPGKIYILAAGRYGISANNNFIINLYNFTSAGYDVYNILEDNNDRTEEVTRVAQIIQSENAPNIDYQLLRLREKNSCDGEVILELKASAE